MSRAPWLNVSAVLDRLGPEERKRLDKAIIDRDPPTYTACYELFKLEELRINFHAFYRYARRLRSHIEMHKIAEATLPASDEAEKLAPRFITQQLLEMLTVEEPASKVILRLAQAYRMYSTIPISRRRLDLSEKKIESAQHARASGPASSPQVSLGKEEPYPPGATYGRDPQTGRPYTKREYMIHTRRSFYDIWGLDMPGEGDTRYRALNPDMYEHLVDEDGDLTHVPYHDYVDFDRNGLNEDGQPYLLPPPAGTIEHRPNTPKIVAEGAEKRKAAAEKAAANGANPPSPPSPRVPSLDKESYLSAPRYGRNPDGRPRTRQEFMAILRPQIYDIYGLDLPKESSPPSCENPSSHDPSRESVIASPPSAKASTESEPPPEGPTNSTEGG